MTLKSMFLTALVVLVLGATSLAKELPEAPSSVLAAGPAMTPVTMSSSKVTQSETPKAAAETKIFDTKFISFAIVSTGSTFADSYTTLFARQNYLAHKTGVCNMEVQSAYLYGTHPTVGRTYGVAAAKSVGAVAAAYYLRKHHSRFWGLPLFANAAVGLEGVTQNMMACN